MIALDVTIDIFTTILRISSVCDTAGWWCVQETATTCRERCGGQGYLSCNRFGAILGFSHAGMTAEGDNRSAPLQNVNPANPELWGCNWGVAWRDDRHPLVLHALQIFERG